MRSTGRLLSSGYLPMSPDSIAEREEAVMSIEVSEKIEQLKLILIVVGIAI